MYIYVPKFRPKWVTFSTTWTAKESDESLVDPSQIQLSNKKKNVYLLCKIVCIVQQIITICLHPLVQ